MNYLKITTGKKCLATAPDSKHHQRNKRPGSEWAISDPENVIYREVIYSSFDVGCGLTPGYTLHAAPTLCCESVRIFCFPKCLIFISAKLLLFWDSYNSDVDQLNVLA